MLKKKIVLPVTVLSVLFASAVAGFSMTGEVPVTTGIGHIDLEIF